VAVTASGLSAVARAAAADVVARAAAAASRPSVVPGPTGTLPVSTTPASTGATGAAPPTAPPRPQQPKKKTRTRFTQTDVSTTIDPSPSSAASPDPTAVPSPWLPIQRFAQQRQAAVRTKIAVVRPQLVHIDQLILDQHTQPYLRILDCIVSDSDLSSCLCALVNAYEDDIVRAVKPCRPHFLGPVDLSDM
jgi:hypothetical protein